MAELTPTRALITWLNEDLLLVAANAAEAGVWEDPGPPDEGDERVFVTVRLLFAPITQCSGRRAFLECLYAVQAVGRAQDITAVRTAAARLLTLLDEGGLSPRDVLSGFGIMGSWAVEPIEYPDPEVTTGIRWEHRGAQFRILVEPT